MNDNRISTGIIALACIGIMSARVSAAAVGSIQMIINDPYESGCKVVHAAGLTPGDGRDDAAALQATVNNLPKEGKTRLIIPKGDYDFFGKDMGGPCILLDGFEDLTIDASGANITMHSVCTTFALNKCRNVRIIGCSIDWKKQPHSVGTVIASTPKTFDVRVLDEFPLTSAEHVTAYMDFDPVTKLPRRKGLDVYYQVEKTEIVAPQTLRVFLKSEIPIQTGVLAVLRHHVYDRNAITISDSSDIMLKDVTIYSAPGMGVVCIHSSNLKFDNLQVRIKPGTQRLVSASADATHFKQCKGLIELKNCFFEGMGDDAANVGSLYLTVREKIDDHTVLGSHNLAIPVDPDVGDEMEFSKSEDLSLYASRKVKSVTPLPDKGLRKVEFTEPLPAEMKAGDVIGNASAAAKLRISGCVVRNNRARGFIIQTRDAIIENCKMENVTSGGVWVCTEKVFFHEGVPARRVIVRNCAFDNCNYGGPQAEGVLAVYATLDGFRQSLHPGVHKDIAIENNVVRGALNSGIFIAATDGLKLVGNTVEKVCEDPSFPSGNAAIYLMSTKNALIKGNTVDPSKQGKAFKQALEFGPAADKPSIKIEGNKGF